MNFDRFLIYGIIKFSYVQNKLVPMNQKLIQVNSFHTTQAYDVRWKYWGIHGLFRLRLTVMLVTSSCWLLKVGDGLWVLVISFECWCPMLKISQKDISYIVDVGDQMAKTVTNILWLSSAHFVSNIRHPSLGMTFRTRFHRMFY